MGDRRKQALRVQFDGKLKLEFHGTKITSDAGLLAFRELDEAFRLTEKASIVLSESRQGKNTQHTMLAMLRQAIYGRLAGYEDVNDAERLRVDPAMRLDQAPSVYTIIAFANQHDHVPDAGVNRHRPDS